MKEILLVNLTRMGDLIQTTPVMEGLKESYPGARITLLVNSVFAEICKDLPFVDRLLALDKPAFRKMILGEEHSLVEVYRRLESFIDSVNDTEYDLAINFTPSGESAILASLFRAREMRGVTAGGDGARVIKHPWQRYFMNVIPSRRYNPFHLSDMMIKAAGIPPSGKGLRLSVSEEESRKARALLAENGVAGDDLLIGFQLGASHVLKTWPAASFARLADRFAEALGARILLTGSPSEEELGKEFESLAAAKAVNLIGKTDLRQVAALLGRCALLVTNDTGPLHMSTAVGTPAIDVSLGHVCFRETGPYGEGHYVIEADIPCGPCGFHVTCEDPRCKAMVTADSVFALGSRILAKGRVECLDDGPLWDGVRVFRSGFALDGLQDYTPLIRRSLSRETFYTYLYRETWPSILDGCAGFSAGEACGSIEGKAAAWHVGGGLEALLREIGDDLTVLRRMEALAGEALTRVSLICSEANRPSPDAEWIRRTWKDVPVIDREIETLGRTHPQLMPPVVLFGFGKEALEGKELAPMAETAVGLYADLKKHFSMLADTIERLVEKQVKAPRGSCNT
ncbi:MAG: glycosyltransferase family 9 protein [Deltaproteobacteria bacterium]|nr:glycosyltransferase family 9 protein [Deltaproteobacteria bacterium]